MLVNLYWSILILAFGACVGSFLNVVIYRWPRDLSIRRPIWSFCPACGATLRFRDNIPIFGYLLLRGRCRSCRAPISAQYPLVELATAMLFLLVYDAFFVAKLREGITDLGADWPILLAHWGLCAGLIVLAVMDLEAYLVDIRVTWIIVVIGLVGHALWTPASSMHSPAWIRPGTLQAAMAIACAVGLAIGAALFLRYEQEPESPELSPQDVPEEESGPADNATPANSDTAPVTATKSARWAWVILPTLAVIAYLAVMVVHEHRASTAIHHTWQIEQGQLVRVDQPAIEPGTLRTGLGLAGLFFALALAASHPHPEEDEEIIEAIDAEADDARHNALLELKLLTPAILLVVAAVLALTHWATPGAESMVERVLHFAPVGRWQPVWGLTTGLAGWVIGGAVGWIARIVFTLALGKEALGMGDVHILAATGAVAGWCVAFLGFFVAALVALLALVVIHLRRQSRALPYGPWLGFGFVIVIIYQDRILTYLNLRELLG